MAGGIGEPVSAFPVDTNRRLAYDWRIGVRLPQPDAGRGVRRTYDAIVKRRIAEVSVSGWRREEIQMATLDTRNYSYRAGREVSRRGTTDDPASLERKYRRVRPYVAAPASDSADDPASLERKYRRVRPYGSVTALGQAKMRAGAVRAEKRQLAD